MFGAVFSDVRGCVSWTDTFCCCCSFHQARCSKRIVAAQPIGPFLHRHGEHLYRNRPGVLLVAFEDRTQCATDPVSDLVSTVTVRLFVQRRGGTKLIISCSSCCCCILHLFRRRQLIHGLGTSSLGYTESVKTLSSIYQETLERPFKSGARHRDHEAVWSQANVPDFLTGPEEEDIMSDTDSDEEEEEMEGEDETTIKWPTVEESETALRATTEEEAAAGGGGSGGLQRGNRRGNRRVVLMARDRTQMLLGKRRATDRFPRASAITDYLTQVDSAIVFPKYKLGF